MKIPRKQSKRTARVEAIDILRNKVPNTEFGTYLYIRLTSFRQAITTTHEPYMTDEYIDKVMNRFAQSIIYAHENTT